jgi:hypothetical protein
VTFARLKATGSGSIAVRLVIEGIAVQPVSDPAMEQTLADGRRRVYCMNVDECGIVIEESVNIPEAVIDASGVTVRMFETQDEDLASVFQWRPSIERELTATLTLAGTSATMGLGTSGLSDDDIVHLGTEALRINGAPGAGSITVEREVWDTIAQQHWAGTGSIPYRSITNRPLRIRGRRVYLHLYGDGDDLQGDGTQVWIGQVTTEPGLEDGTTWMLMVDSIAARLDAKLGGELESPMRPRGIYYSWAAPLLVRIAENAFDEVSMLFTGFYETQRAFLDALNVDLATMTAGLDNQYEAVETEDGRWTIRSTILVTTTDLWVKVVSAIDGSAGPASFASGIAMFNESGVVQSAASIGDRLYPEWEDVLNGFAIPGARFAPRGYFGIPPVPSREGHPPRYTKPSHRLIYPAERIYLSGDVSSDWSAVLIEWPTGDSYDYQATAVDTANRSVTLRNSVSTGRDGVFFSVLYNAHQVPVITPTRELAGGTIADFRDALVTEGPLYANRGSAPFLTTTDLADWTAVAAEAALRRERLSRRRWTLVSPLDLTEVLSHELRLIGAYPIIDSTGKIAIALIDVPNVADATPIDDELISVGWSTLERGGQTINRVILHTHYDPKEDEWGGELPANDYGAYALDHIDATLDIEPRSRALVDESRITAEEIADLAQPIFGLFGYPHDFVTVHVSYKLFDLVLGSAVSFSAEHIPNFSTGQRPATAIVGIVVGRKWAIGEEHGTLRLLLPWLGVAGYSPTARITAAVNVTGNQWDLTLDPSMYATSAHADDEYWDVGYVVRAIQYDTESATPISGTVDAVNTTTHVVRVTFDAPYTLSAVTAELCWPNYADQTADQQAGGYAAFADSTGTLDGDSPDLFAP